LTTMLPASPAEVFKMKVGQGGSVKVGDCMHSGVFVTE
jgi:hypothetical protein